MKKILMLVLALSLTALPAQTWAQEAPPTVLCADLIDHLNIANELTEPGFPDTAAAIYTDFFKFVELRQEVAQLSLDPICWKAQLALSNYIATYQDLAFILISTEAIVISRDELNAKLQDGVEVRDEALADLVYTLNALGFAAE